MGLNVSVYKFPLGDCTNNGISGGDTRELCLVNVDGPFNPRPGIPAAMLVNGNMQGLAKIVPAKELAVGFYTAEGWWMMGGNFGHTSDSRFREAVEKITGHPSSGAIPIHDWQE